MIDKPPDFVYTPIGGASPDQPKRPHSVFGIVSFALALLNVLFSCVYFVFVAVSGENPAGGDTFFLLIGLVAIVVLFSVLTGIVLGIVGLSQKDKRKEFSIFGLVLQGLLLLTYVGLYILGSVGP